MALTASQVLASVRATLDYPGPDQLKKQTILLKIRDKVEHFFNRMNLTDRNWFLNSELLQVDIGRDEYSLSSSDWGRPIMVETEDENDQWHVRREVPIIDLQDRDLLYEGPVAAGLSLPSGLRHSATSIAFYRSASNQPTCKITPSPSISATYRIWYEPNKPIPATLAQNLPLLQQFQNLLVAEVSLDCLPYCHYETTNDRGTPVPSAFGANLRATLERNCMVYGTTFEEYIQNDRQQSISIKRMWGDNPVGEDGGDW